MERLFGTDGIRGRANFHPITPEVALQVGKAIAHVFGASGHGSRRAVLGKDTRLSGYMLETALTSGLVSMGIDVFLVGVLPTPAVAHLTRSMAATVGIMLTASHNPFDDNGIKIFDSEGFKLSDELELQIERHVLDGDLTAEHIRSDTMGKAYRIEDARGRYIEFAKGTVGHQNLSGLHVVLDCSNGAAYRIGPWIFEELGARVTKAYASPDGYNINNGCGALHPETVGQLVRQYHADVGVALDGDADRVIFTDSTGAVVDGDRILAMCALDFHARGRLAHNTLVVTTMSNLGLHAAMAQHGIRIVTTDVGDRQVIEAMRTAGYNLGGEKSGHVIFMDYATTGDGIITALQVLRLMKTTGRTLRELADCMTEYPQKLVSLAVRARPPLETVPGLPALLDEARRVFGDDGRVVVRYSGTEPKVRVLVEGRSDAIVQEWCGRIAELLKREIGA